MVSPGKPTDIPNKSYEAPGEPWVAIVNPSIGEPIVAARSCLVSVYLKIPNKTYEAQVVSLCEPFSSVVISDES